MNLAQLFAQAPRPGRAPAPSPERQARDNAVARESGASLTAPAGQGRVLSNDAPETLGAGRPLPAQERARMEAGMGRDFSGVRVHADSAAADAMGAAAFAYGRDIVFGSGQYAPHTSSGRGLLAHELTHIAQQAEKGAPSVQMQPKGELPGIGSAPPAVEFDRADGVGPEDGSVLFALDKADLSAPARKALQDLIGKHKGPVTVQIHGYASSEGQGPELAEYNVNLSAHRAAAVKAFLESKLPAGSKFKLVAHGESTAFAPLAQNRRAGVVIKDGVEKPEDAKKKVEEDAKKEPARLPGLGIVPQLTLGPPLPLAPYRLPIPVYVPPPLFGAPPMKFGEIAWDDLSSKARDRGILIDPRLGTSLEQHAYYSYNFFLPFVGRDLAITASNFATSFVFDDWLAKEHANAFDRSNAQFKLDYPDEKHLVFKLGSDLIDAIRMKIKGSKKDDYLLRF